MVKKKFLYKNNRLYDYFLSILLFPLIVFKKIGDIPILLISSSSKRLNYILHSKTIRSGNNQNRIIYKKRKSIFTDFEKIKLPNITLPFRQNRTLRKKIRFSLIKLRYFTLGNLITGVLFFLAWTYFQAKSLPNPAYLTLRDTPSTTKIFDRKGRLLYEIYANENRIPIKLSEIPQDMINATIAIEDKEFFSHKGFSLRGILRAFIHNSQKDNIEGGSTITQQLVRSAFLTPEKTISRKIKELVLSIWTEQIYSKEQILEMYFNQIPYGGTAWGIEAAAQTYFGKSVKDLDLAESAFLSGLPASPTVFSPYGQTPQLSKLRQEEVLNRMLEDGFINDDIYKKSKEEKLEIKKPRTPIAAPHFVMYTKDLLIQTYGSKITEQSGLRVTTTLDLDIQNMAERILADQINALKPLNVGNGAVLITDPKNGQILAMVGSKDYFDYENQGNFNVVLSKRQPGSSIKVVNYASALQNGYTAASILEDTPVSYWNAGSIPYKPVNYDGRYHGRVSLRLALGSSYNIPAVKVLAIVGVKKMVETGRLMGVESWDDDSGFGLSLTLGAGEVTMMDLTRIYGTLANNGIRNNLTPFITIQNWKGENLQTPDGNKVRALPKSTAFILSDILSDNLARTPAFGPNSELLIPGHTVAVKTGTSDSKRDNWTIGYNPDYLVSVWVGNNDNTPMNPTLTSGVTGAAPIWHNIMSELLKNSPDKSFQIPDDVIGVICQNKIEYFLSGTEPKGCPQRF
jgi:penicillin-binding protein 1C